MSCHTMQKRIMELIEQIQNEDVTGLIAMCMIILPCSAAMVMSSHGFVVEVMDFQPVYVLYLYTFC